MTPVIVRSVARVMDRFPFGVIVAYGMALKSVGASVNVTKFVMGFIFISKLFCC